MYRCRRQSDNLDEALDKVWGVWHISCRFFEQKGTDRPVSSPTRFVRANQLSASQPTYRHPCTLPNRSLWFGHASLYEEHIVIEGWTWQGRYRREVLVRRIESVNWRSRLQGPNLELTLDDGSRVSFRLQRGVGLWNAKLHALLGQSMGEGTRPLDAAPSDPDAEVPTSNNARANDARANDARANDADASV
jgi:hypothetical protein